MRRFFAVALVAGCAHAPATTTPPVQRIEMEPMKIEVVRTPTGQRVEAFDAATLFEQAGADLHQQRWTEAAAGYDRLVRDFADSRYVAPSLYNAGLAFEGLRDFSSAATRYRTLADKHPGTQDALDALFRLGGCYAELTNWAASAEVFARVLEEKDLSLGDRVEAMARRGLAQYQMKDPGAAERTFRGAVEHWRANETVERLDHDFFLAMCGYYLGEIAHDQFRAMPVRLPEKQMKEDLEAKARLLLVAQKRYMDVPQVYKNLAWSSAAAYQWASLYKELYDALVGAPIPPQLGDEAKRIYVEEVRKQIEPLVRKALRIHEAGLQMAQRTGLDNDWVRKSNEQAEQLRALLTPVSPEGVKPSLPLPPPPVRPEPPARPDQDKREQAPRPPGREDYRTRVVL